MGITSVALAIAGIPIENESVTIKPKTAEDQVFNSLSETNLCRSASAPTATPIAIKALMSTNDPSGRDQIFFRDKLVICVFVGHITGHHRIAVIMVIANKAAKVYCIKRFFDIVPVMCGADLTTSSLVDSLLIFDNLLKRRILFKV
jgi:hypothetical protein